MKLSLRHHEGIWEIGRVVLFLLNLDTRRKWVVWLSSWLEALWVPQHVWTLRSEGQFVAPVGGKWNDDARAFNLRPISLSRTDLRISYHLLRLPLNHQMSYFFWRPANDHHSLRERAAFSRQLKLFHISTSFLWCLFSITVWFTSKFVITTS